MYPVAYLQETLLNLFIIINLNLSNSQKKTLAELIVCLLENNKAHISSLQIVNILFINRKQKV